MCRMKQPQTKKQKIIALIDDCIKNIEETNNLQTLSKNIKFKETTLYLDKIVEIISVVNPNIKKIKFKNIKNKKKKGSSKLTGFFLMLFCILAIFLGFLGKYLSRPGFYNFKEQDKYISILLYSLMIVAAIIGLILYIKYKLTINKKKLPVNLSTYCYNLRILKDIINKMRDNEINYITEH